MHIIYILLCILYIFYYAYYIYIYTITNTIYALLCILYTYYIIYTIMHTIYYIYLYVNTHLYILLLPQCCSLPGSYSTVLLQPVLLYGMLQSNLRRLQSSLLLVPLPYHLKLMRNSYLWAKQFWISFIQCTYLPVLQWVLLGEEGINCIFMVGDCCVIILLRYTLRLFHLLALRLRLASVV